MKQWNGLMRKEWLAMKGWFYGSLIMLLIAILFLLLASSEELSVRELLSIFSTLWIVFSVVLPTMILLVSLNKEMHRPDIWLHSTAPTVKLFGVKMVFASIIGFVNILFPFIIFLIVSKFSAVIVIMSFLLAIFSMCIGLFLGVLYQLLKPVVKGFSGPIVVMIFLFLSWLQARLAESAIYTKITYFGRLNQEVAYDIQKESFSFEFASMEIHTGELIIDTTLAVLFFIAATTLFDKKVRL
ncbi:hypothetical protein [Sporosarcina jiandibaonis]|uniref:hypothetical protein n=1 Tax=Sporosarcina jiandibaonis TaxID=2715535 RepID=UPI0015564089|nr:hypothetical protein [Sporosarcina jiandibaonis]